MYMKKTYEMLNLQIRVYEDDVITSSLDWQGDYDDKGAWKDSWNNLVW